MQRKIIKYLIDWKKNPYRKPLILQGARQVGKTYSLLEFGREQYENVAYFNFETSPTLNRTFEENIDPNYLIPILSRLSGQTIIKEKTLIILDEIQLCERALTSLKYFCENAPEYHIVVAGSLLGVAVNRENFSFPVGKVDMKTLYPMDIEEFLLACGETELVDQINNSFLNNIPLPSALHETALSYYRQYLVVGGMPDCVKKFIETKDYILVRHTQDMILASYLNDMSKYNNSNEIKKTRLVYDNITVQLSKKNTRFQYKLIKTGARAAEFENAIEWLVLSGIVTLIHRVEHPKKPLENYRDIDSFKTYVSDVGLLGAKKDIIAEDVLFLSDELNDFKGGMVENFVCCQLIANGYKSYYWTSERGAEVDFIIQREGKIIPLEVKSADNTKAKSLTVYINTHNPEYAIKLSTKNFGFEDGKKTVPLYAAFCI
ncbi:putative ATPase (AAA+ superfamily) [Desulfitobacterium dichloroeliminans LMG P-21439]|uniref:Putative ATPase (AAA+ superfamily) n=1 Tax=Desulfitobacterium dichloroeliminans (strain LMG P-21439 / DCA1) TaxID=871963 RepID=L0FD56_DESDL|nr:putative ATPase (AAA+ superfamily) [Desulfitobacterium dichloroeliminans LMG P-21439]